jgi:hypothetical protein
MARWGRQTWFPAKNLDFEATNVFFYIKNVSFGAECLVFLLEMVRLGWRNWGFCWGWVGFWGGRGFPFK